MSRLSLKLVSVAVLALLSISIAFACTRVIYVGEKNLVITGRSMNWSEDMRSNL